ncbi:MULTISPECIES: hypothetical protein [unclassified Carboxylicivirga]|uniref:hypothetical protein n=1 Tax=Carboxylicivirga TaxID=1628153 RepID=UPI003D32A1A6
MQRGATILTFLQEDLIDKMVLTPLPFLSGIDPTLFAELPNELQFELIKTKNLSESVNTESL